MKVLWQAIWAPKALTIDADIPFFAKGMVAGPLQEGIEKVADALSMIPYE